MKKFYQLSEAVKHYKRLIFQLLNVVLLVLFINANCNKSDVLSPEDTDITNESAISRGTTEIQKILASTNSYIIMVANNVTSISGSCPAVTINQSANTITVDFGSSPCSNNLDSVKRSGSYTINYFINSTKDSLAASINFSNYIVYQGINNDTNFANISGTNQIVSKKIVAVFVPHIANYQSTFTVNDNVTPNTGNVKTVSLNLTSNVVINDPQTYSEYSYFISGSGTVTNQSTNISYNYTVDPSYPINYPTNCEYPESGKIYLDLNSDRFTVDFSPYNNNCDDVITITKFGITKYANLSSVGF